MSPVYPFLQIGSHAFEMSEESSKPLGAQAPHAELLLCLLACACLSAVNAALTLPHPPVEPFSSPFCFLSDPDVPALRSPAPFLYPPRVSLHRFRMHRDQCRTPSAEPFLSPLRPCLRACRQTLTRVNTYVFSLGLDVFDQRCNQMTQQVKGTDSSGQWSRTVESGSEDGRGGLSPSVFTAGQIAR